MCGIIAILKRPSGRETPPAGPIIGTLDEVVAELHAVAMDLGSRHGSPPALEHAASLLDGADVALRGTPGVACLLAEPGLAVAEVVARRLASLEAEIRVIEDRLDAEVLWSPSELEAVNAALVRLKDGAWAIGRDRVAAARAIADLWRCDGRNDTIPVPALDALWAIQTALSSLDRLEVRGRDSAGLHVLVTGHGLDLAGASVRALLGSRARDPLFTSMAVRTPLGQLSFVYKAAAEIGELGDNTRALRAAIGSDRLLRCAIAGPDARCVVLGHTRWASVGVISQANAHPLNSEEVGRTDGPYVIAALNGDVDNFADLRAVEGLAIPAEVTTDAKVIPTLVSRSMAGGCAVDDAFRTVVDRFDGSVAIAASTPVAPDRVHLALRGSGQALYIGLAEDAYIVASEPYGLVEETSAYLRMDGEISHG
ncbi:MAG TPA: glucosamine-6-phosphate synthase, partial [Acidimicrobiales bacterium]|nr:glucosamine-6-phosphate synthase [Acidimicrobiales bacterium]